MNATLRRRTGRVPLRYQLTPTECGAACLAMVASYHGRDTRVSECRELLELGRDGVSARRLAEAAPAYGLRARVDLGDSPLDEPLTEPAIAFLTEHHFVVVERIGRRSVRVADPAGGRQRWRRAEFTERFGGGMVRLAPGPDFTPRRVPLRHNQVVRYLREFVAVPGGRRLLAAIVLFAALMQGLGLVLPLATAFAVDTIVPTARHDLLGLFAIVVIGTAVLQGLLALLRSRLLLALRARADVLLTQRFVAHLLRLPLPFFLQRSRGDLLMRLSSVSSTRETLTQQVLTVFLDGALLSGYVVGLALLAPPYLGVVVALGLAQVALLACSYRPIGMLARRELIAKAEEQNYLVETLEAVASVKANGIESRTEARWRELFDTYRDAMVRRGRFTAWITSAQGALGTLAPLALLWFGIWLVLGGRMSLGATLAANSVAMSVLGPLQTFVGTSQMFAALRAQIERIYDVLDAPEEPTGDVRLPGTSPAAVAAHDLTFGYHAERPPVLCDINFTLPPGHKLGIVGRTGSGKSTLALLLLGLLRTRHGQVVHDGVPIDRLDLAALRSGFGVVLQELTLFNGSIRDNLTLGRPDITEHDIEAATRTAGLHEDVLRLPMGYDTLVGEGGAALSAGQRQRVALARALVQRPRLLVLDEATSHLDPQTERRVDEALSRLHVSRIVISHRLSAVRNADQILVLDQGRIVACGRHEELIEEEGGLYRALFAPSSNGSAPRADDLALARPGALNV